METITQEIRIYDYNDVKNNVDGIQLEVVSNWHVIMDHITHEIIQSEKGFKDSLPNPEYEGMTGIRLRTWIINNYLPIIEQPKQYWACRMSNGTLRHNCVGPDSIKRESNLQKEISCPFTGIGYDHEYLDNIMEFIDNPNDCVTWEDLTDVRQLTEDLINDEYNYMSSLEYILDEIEANDYKFTNDGKIY